MTAGQSRIHEAVGTARIFSRVGVLPVAWPWTYVTLARAMRRYGLSPAATFAAAAIRKPDHVAVIDERESLTWSQVVTRSSTLAARLVERHGDSLTVALMARNSVPFVEAVVGSLMAGGRVVLLNTGFGAPQLASAVAGERSDLLIADAEFGELLGDIPEELPKLVAATEAGASTDTVDGLIDSAPDGARVLPKRPGRMVLLTSGTSGAPKGAERGGTSSGVATLAGFFDRIPLSSDDVTVIAAPMFHAWGFAGLTLSSLRASTVVVSRRFDPESVLAQVHRHRATTMWLVPVMLERIMALDPAVRRKYDLSSLRVVALSGSAVRHEAVVGFMDEYGDIVYNNYSSTEVGWAAIATPHDLRSCPGTAGKPPRGTELKILDDHNRAVRDGSTGRIFVRNDSLFEGYTGGGGKAVVDGYMETGDVGHLDVTGRLYVDGRSDDMIVSGGENVYPREVEMVIQEHPCVVDVAVVGVADDQFGQRLDAFVVVTDDTDPARVADTLCGHVRANLARHKVPRHVYVVSELPRNAAGKVVKRDLTAMVGDA
ncbi:AMP-binding protein [Mycobacterium sp. GA-2829]|uniref:AMP-binding protein n=1 Tax=Mycobacterium sp. GA-2829 TaxID=1772283 RepID=UPI00073FC0ED|nr:AMP-binding protein [Mycobacterium sp. GA-2829]KUI29210.1 hypothetical protein AU194_20230 [Mycobacterium sp. GA-2829]